jgi:hypothetical protein
MIDTTRALVLLEESVKERGENFVYYNAYQDSYNLYDACRYQVDDQPACLVGLALAKAGLTVEELGALEGMSISNSYGMRAVPRERLEITDDALRVLATAQTVQDNDHAWGDALQTAKLEAETLRSGTTALGEVADDE